MIVILSIDNRGSGVQSHQWIHEALLASGVLESASRLAHAIFASPTGYDAGSGPVTSHALSSSRTRPLRELTEPTIRRAAMEPPEHVSDGKRFILAMKGGGSNILISMTARGAAPVRKIRVRPHH